MIVRPCHVKARIVGFSMTPSPLHPYNAEDPSECFISCPCSARTFSQAYSATTSTSHSLNKTRCSAPLNLCFISGTHPEASLLKRFSPRSTSAYHRMSASSYPLF